MPWGPDEFRKRHNKKLSAAQAKRAARIANSVLRRTGDDAQAIRVANSAIQHSG